MSIETRGVFFKRLFGKEKEDPVEAREKVRQARKEREEKINPDVRRARGTIGMLAGEVEEKVTKPADSLWDKVKGEVLLPESRIYDDATRMKDLKDLLVSMCIKLEKS